MVAHVFSAIFIMFQKWNVGLRMDTIFHFWNNARMAKVHWINYLKLSQNVIKYLIQTSLANNSSSLLNKMSSVFNHQLSSVICCGSFQSISRADAYRTFCTSWLCCLYRKHSDPATSSPGSVGNRQIARCSGLVLSVHLAEIEVSSFA